MPGFGKIIRWKGSFVYILYCRIIESISYEHVNIGIEIQFCDFYGRQIFIHNCQIEFVGTKSPNKLIIKLNEITAAAKYSLLQ